MTRVVLAPDSFKGSIAAADAAQTLAAGWRSVQPSDTLVLRPMADGGEGTLDAFAAAVEGARRMPVAVTGPDDTTMDAAWLLLPDGTAVVELASTSGIELLGERRLPQDAHTIGFGQAVAAALDFGVARLVLGIGSSASTDGGTGMLTALGARFADAQGDPVAPGARGLEHVAVADLAGIRPLPSGGVVVLSDVTNPLLGPLGAAAVFGPQKGLDADGVARADAGLARLAHLLPADPAEAGTGAAGGTGFGLRAWGAQLRPGAPEVAELIALEAAIAEADVVVTGEGSFDGQSAAGKVPSFVQAVASTHGVPVLLVAGRIAPDADLSGFTAAASLTALARSPERAMAEPARWLRAAGEQLAASPSRGS